MWLGSLNRATSRCFPVTFLGGLRFGLMLLASNYSHLLWISERGLDAALLALHCPHLAAPLSFLDEASKEPGAMATPDLGQPPVRSWETLGKLLHLFESECPL